MKRAGIFMTLLLPVTLLLALGNMVNGRVQAKPQLIDVSGTIATDTTWTVDNSPYILTDTVTVQTGVTLTIEAGVTVQTPDTGEYLDVQGHLEAVGTAVNPILFTSIDDLPANNWSGISVSGSANLEFVTMRHAYTALFISSGSAGVVSLMNSTLEENLVYPIKVTTDALHRLTMDNVAFSNNVPNRVGIETFGGNLTLAGSPTLSPQPGLEGYEELNTDIPTVFSIPEGMTLTLQPGTNLMMLSTVQLAGHVAASGTVTEPVTWQTVPGSDGGVFSIVVLPTGTAVLTHTTLKGSPEFGLAVVGESDALVLLENSTLEGMGDYPLIIDPPSLHRVQMNNVTFLNNAINRVMVDTQGGKALAADVTLSPQPGLEWYEIADFAQTWPPEFVVPEGITLTVEPGVEMRFGVGAETMVVNGRLQAIGTPTSPITFTSVADLAPGEWEGIILQGGSANLDHTIVRNSEDGILIGALDASDTVQIANSFLQSNSNSPLAVTANTLHQLTLNNVTFSNNQNGDHIVIYENGALAGDVTLTAQPGLSGYVVYSSPTTQLIVPDSLNLSLEQGTMLKFFGSNHELLVQGHLQTRGTSLQPVIFTSLADSAPNQWGGIVIENGTAQLDYAEVRNGEYNVVVNNTAVSSPVVLQNSQIHNAESVGLWVIDGAVTANCSRFINNSGSGVLIWNSGNPDVAIVSSALAGNADAGLRNENVNLVDAANNWWGDASGPAGIGPGSGDVVLGNVLFDPWLQEDTCTTVTYQLYLPAVVKP